MGLRPSSARRRGHFQQRRAAGRGGRERRRTYPKISVSRDLGTEIEVRAGVNPGDQVVLNPPVDLVDGVPSAGPHLRQRPCQDRFLVIDRTAPE
jgi:hypothetical protein